MHSDWLLLTLIAFPVLVWQIIQYKRDRGENSECLAKEKHQNTLKLIHFSTRKLPIFFISVITLTAIGFTSYWAYFKMRYDVLSAGGRPVRYDTWTNEYTNITRHQEATNPEEVAVQAPAPEAAPAPVTSHSSSTYIDPNTGKTYPTSWTDPSTGKTYVLKKAKRNNQIKSRTP